jgi:hypothetical protein
MKPQPHVVRSAHELWLIKTSDGGCSVEPGMSPPDSYKVTDAVREATCTLFNPTKDGLLQAGQQLRLAKSKGAEKAILLLDCGMHHWYPSVVTQVFASKHVDSIDIVYLVEVSSKRVSEVWPCGKSNNA